MIFLDREQEMERLDAAVRARAGGILVIHGRRRIGKTRLLLEWCERHDGLYAVFDRSTSDVQRRYFAGDVAQRFPGFDDVTYPDWRSLLERLSREARGRGWRGPLVLDEIPYAVSSAPELPSVLQRWVDHDVTQARLVLAIAGSSQRMMQGIVLSAAAPLFGRAREILEIGPIRPRHLREAFPGASDRERIELHAAWGGVPRYWELAEGVDGGPRARVERLVLDPLGPLHREPDRLLLEEMPPAVEVRPLLDAIGAGAHRMSEIAGRIGRPATSLARPLSRLVDLGLARREVPFGEPERRTKRSLYRIADPFMRLWFRVVAPYRGRLAAGSRADRQRLLLRLWPGLVAEAFEDLCRLAVPGLASSCPAAAHGPWGPAARWWHGTAPEWDLVSESLSGDRLLLGEVRWRARPVSRATLERELARLAAKPAPDLPDGYRDRAVVRALFVPETADAPRDRDDPVVVTAAHLFP